MFFLSFVSRQFEDNNVPSGTKDFAWKVWFHRILLVYKIKINKFKALNDFGIFND